MADFLDGAIMMAYAVAALFFLKFWRESRDRLFAMFGLAFFILSVNRIGIPGRPVVDEGLPVFYIVRLFAFLLILVAIIDKNYSGKK
jgi:hypothetical protein